MKNYCYKLIKIQQHETTINKNRMKKHFLYLMLIAWSFTFSSTAANRYVSVGGSGNGLSWLPPRVLFNLLFMTAQQVILFSYRSVFTMKLLQSKTACQYWAIMHQQVNGTGNALKPFLMVLVGSIFNCKIRH